MLRTNLSTRPFYNVRAVAAALSALAFLVLAVTAFNVVQVVRLSGLERALGDHVSIAEAEAERLRADAARLRADIDPAELEAVAAATSEANGIIDRRTFSWSELLDRLEAILPPDVRISRVQPREPRGGGFEVVVDAQARTYADLNAFLEALEADGFHDVIAPSTMPDDEQALIRAVIQGTYTPARAAVETAGTAPAGEVGE